MVGGLIYKTEEGIEEHPKKIHDTQNQSLGGDNSLNLGKKPKAGISLHSGDARSALKNQKFIKGLKNPIDELDNDKVLNSKITDNAQI